MQRIRSLPDYFKKYEQSQKDPENFWSEIASSFIWKALILSGLKMQN